MLTFYAHTRPGIEQIAWLEIRQKFPSAKFRQYHYAKNAFGVVIFDYDGSLGDLLTLQTVDTVYLSVLSLPKVTRGRQDLRDIRQKLIESGNIGQAINEVGRWRRKHQHTYSLTTHKEGKHQYSHGELADILTRGMEQLYPQWSVSTRPDIPLRADLLGSHLLIGIRISKKSRQDAEVTLPASVASAMVWLSDPAGTDTFFDPLPFKPAILKARLAMSEAKLIYGGMGIGKMRRPPAGVMAQRWNRNRFPMRALSVDKVVSYWPASFLEDYPTLLEEIERVLTGKAVILTHCYEDMKEMIRYQPGLEIKTGYSLLVGGEWGRIYIIERVTG